MRRENTNHPSEQDPRTLAGIPPPASGGTNTAPTAATSNQFTSQDETDMGTSDSFYAVRVFVEPA